MPRLAWSHQGGWRDVLRLSVADNRFTRLDMGERLLPPLYSDVGEYMLPGLIDGHVHLAGNPERLDHTRAAEDAHDRDLSDLDWVIGRARQNLAKAAGVGITTVRDVGSLGPHWKKVLRVLNSRPPAGTALPRVHSAGRFLTAPGGHGADHGGLIVRGAQLGRAAARLINDGAAFVKVMNDPVMFTTPELTTAATAASGAGVALGVHAYTDAGARVALAGGAHVIEHLGAYTPKTISEIARRRVQVVTTIVAGFDTVADPTGSGADQLFADANLALFRQWYADTVACLPRMTLSGVQLVAGSDAGFPGTDFDSLPREFVALRMLGLDPQQAVGTVTAAGARVLGRPSDLGVLAPGAWADWVSYDGNPLVNPRLLRSPLACVISGMEFSG